MPGNFSLRSLKMNVDWDKTVNAADLANAYPELYLKAVVGGADIDAAEHMVRFASACGFGPFELTYETAACFLGTLKKV